MSSKTFTLSDDLHAYLIAVGTREPEIFARLRAETAALPNAGMQISIEQGQFLRLLIPLLGVRRALEVGVFTGYSSLSVATALPEGGTLVACDVSEEYTSMARRYWAAAGVADRIALHIAPATATLETLLDDGHAETFDFAFIDADKSNYDHYYEAALRLVRPGGLITVDNTLWSGRVLDEADQSADTIALRALNAKIHADARVDVCLLPIGDGLTLARKKMG